ncbi:MAG: autophagy protein Apg6-domain-containing protein, partial [Olpidium bornovanus]
RQSGTQWREKPKAVLTSLPHGLRTARTRGCTAVDAFKHGRRVSAVVVAEESGGSLDAEGRANPCCPPGAQGPGRPLGDERGAGAPHDYYVVLPNHLGTAPAAAPAKGAEQFPAPSLLDTGEDKPARSSLSYRLKVTDRLLASASATEVQHPMCEECAETLLQIMNERVEEMSEEKDAYEAFLAEHAGDAPTEEDERQLEREIVELEAKEKDAIRAIKDIERQRSQLQEEMRLLAREEEELDQLTDKLGQQPPPQCCPDFRCIRLQRFRDERDGVNLKYDHDARLLGKLQRTNVYNDAFRIGHDGHFATINGLRLGRLPGQNVDWNEINAAYGSGDLHIGRLFLNRRFDNAMVAFLNCLKQLGDYAEEADPSAKLPYSINKERIGDVSIRLQFNNDEAWTKALKYTLTNTKVRLALPM